MRPASGHGLDLGKASVLSVVCVGVCIVPTQHVAQGVDRDSSHKPPEQ